MKNTVHTMIAATASAALALALCLLVGPQDLKPRSQDLQPAENCIIQGADLSSVTEEVLAVGGTITHDLRIIHAVGVALPRTSAKLFSFVAMSRSM